MSFQHQLKTLIFSIVLLIFAVALVIFYKLEQNYSMGIKIISEEQAAEYDTFVSYDYSEYIFFNGYPVAADRNTRTIYICQDEEYCFQNNFYNLSGKLTLERDDCKMFLVRDDNFENLHEAVTNGETFRLIIAQEKSSAYTDYNIVITSLPVISINGSYSFTDEKLRELYFGDVAVYSPKKPDIQHYSVASSATYWRNRGDRSYLKKSYKLSLKDANHLNVNKEFLNLGKDDDWLLNSMKIDDTFVKERLIMQLWNNLCETASYNRKMSYGEFCEVIINGEYKGLYMLQRRVDKKYLELSENDILARGGDVYVNVPIEQDVELVYSPCEDDYTYSLLNQFYSLEDCSQININNFIDINIFLQFGMMLDNYSLKNIIYIMDYISENNYEMSLLLWDTDASFIVNKQQDIEKLYFRRETDAIKQLYPNLDKLTAQRWFELREELLDLENIYQTIDAIYSEFSQSGAIARDYVLWGHYSADDSIEKLYSTIKNRLEFLDNYYSQYL